MNGWNGVCFPIVAVLSPWRVPLESPLGILSSAGEIDEDELKDLELHREAPDHDADADADERRAMELDEMERLRLRRW